ncbi:MAG TPA: aldehyde dehydrogenase family protein [Amycolatopsis sp.]|uniref:aldehyde dehydrogenase family protein n=1 Tax=Amycolatopsis sp. TaxID=37632 RepID=UPI002B4962BD|nr:aldehyde dehydrogenase family protein [Amycolatopsis sp.]HKS46127.1 aldehyde dehydrogenase family protein [Amycolatopsis sp.]
MDLPVVRPTVGAEPLDSADHQVLTGVTGQPVAVVHTAPPLLVQLALRRIARADDAPVPAGVFTEAGRLFATATLDDETPDEYCARAASASGVPVGVYRRALGHVSAELSYMDTVGPPAVSPVVIAPGVEAAVRWVPRGRLLTVICPSNHPEPHLTWVRGLAAGYRVLVRPGSADPFTPARLSAALVKAGLPADRLALLPSDHGTADLLVRTADRAIVYGGPAAARRWRGHPAVLVRGPGYSKALVDVPATGAVIDHLASAVAGDGGVRCTNTSVIRTGDDTLATALAARLGAIPVHPVTDPDAVLPAVPTAVAEAVREQLGNLLAGGMVDHSGYAADPFATSSDGSLVARPVVLGAPAGVAVPDVELPLPFVIVAPWQPGDGLAPLRNSLVLNILGQSREALPEPTVRKVVHGAVPPWTTAPGLPHDGSLTDFLLEPKTVLRET